MSVAEVADDAEAPPAVREIYADIRAVTGNEVVNLIYRRLAAQDPALLQAVWTRLRAPYASGRFDALARCLTPPLPAVAPRADLLSEPQMRQARALVSIYDANNRRNFVAFSALLGRQRSCEPSGGFTRPPAPPPDGTSIPALPPLASLSEDVKARLATLNRFANPEGLPQTPSLYRHLALWPTLLPACEAALAPLEEAGELTVLMDETRRRGQSAAAALPELALPAAERTAVEGIADGLVKRVMPRIIPIARLIGRLLGLQTVTDSVT